MQNNTVNELLSKLTLEEKATLCVGKDFWRLHGIERLGLPSIMVTDGPHGMRKQPDGADHMGLQNSVPATCFPTASALAATWNRELLQRVGVALGEEALAEDVSVLLGPGVNIKRHPLGGRNFEYFSEDPFLAGEMATAWVNGVQSTGVGTSLKHFAVNNHEHGRMTVDAIVDERTLREIYLPAFEATVKNSQPWTVMCAYNKLNGHYLAEHTELLTNVLQNEWGFEGIVVTDWGANNDRVAGIKAGQHLEMPSSGDINVRKIIAAVNSGELSVADLDQSVSRVLALIVKAKDTLERDQATPKNHQTHHNLAREAAEQGAVLLKNDGALLPLAKTGKIAVLGALATHTRYQGSGSSQINPTQLEQPLDEIEQLVGKTAKVAYSLGYGLKGDLTFKQKTDALAAAESADVVILFAGLTPEYESEGFDREHLNLPRQQRDLITALAPHYHKLVIVLANGAPVTMPFVSDVPVILEAYLGGQAGASALARILFGDVNPSGKLAETFPTAQTDVPSDAWFPGTLRQSQYREGIWVGYRFFDTAQVAPLFPFGHGLSYSRFDYSDVMVNQDLNTEIELGKAPLTISAKITNVGERAGFETVQLYVGQENPRVPRPKKELRNFAKVWLEAGASEVVSFTLNERDFAYWCSETHAWRADSDQYVLSLGSSSADIRLSVSLSLKTMHPNEDKAESLAPYFTPRDCDFNDEAFQALLGHPIPKPVPLKPYHTNSAIKEIQSTWVGRFLKKNMMREITKAMGELPEENRLMMEGMINDMPLRNISLMSEGKLPETTLHRMIHLMNGSWFKAITGKPCATK